MKFNIKSGFTLVELLVVIGVLGVLATGVLIAINPAEMLSRSRDSSRKSSLKQIGDALERYRVAAGRYPQTPGNNWCGAPGSYYTSCGADWIPGLVASGELKVLPQDPSVGKQLRCSSSRHTSFIYRSNGTDYKLVAHCAMESRAGISSCTAAKFSAGTQDQFCDPPRYTYSWAIWSSATSRGW
jgi:prepilin-type N-terminal cleavage/methylation domain-containing protein